MTSKKNKPNQKVFIEALTDFYKYLKMHTDSGHLNIGTSNGLRDKLDKVASVVDETELSNFDYIVEAVPQYPMFPGFLFPGTNLNELMTRVRNVLNTLRKKSENTSGKAGQRSQKKRQKPPLPDRDMAVLKLLENLPERKGLTGKQILQALDEKKIYIDQSSLTKNIIPRLKHNGYRVRNKRNGAGYYIEK